MTREMGKVLAETRGDVQEAIDMTYYMAGEGRRLFGQTTPSELPNKFAMSMRQSIGVCGLITPWNFPMAIPAWKMMPALVCGNTLVIKPAEDTPLSNVSPDWNTFRSGGCRQALSIWLAAMDPERARRLRNTLVFQWSVSTGSTSTGPDHRGNLRAQLQALQPRDGAARILFW